MANKDTITKTCKVEDCEKVVLSKDLCGMHYKRLKLTGSLDKKDRSRICSIEGCGKKHDAKGFCESHYKLYRLYGTPVSPNSLKPTICSVEGCLNRVHGGGLCSKHYLRSTRHGRLHSVRREYGTGSIHVTGYMTVIADSGKRAMEHRAIVENILGKKLPKSAVIHHVDHDRLNNFPTNLVVCPDSAYHNLIHRRERALDACGNPNAIRCKFCKTYDNQDDIILNKEGYGYHRSCAKSYRKIRHSLKAREATG